MNIDAAGLEVCALPHFFLTGREDFAPDGFTAFLLLPGRSQAFAFFRGM